MLILVLVLVREIESEINLYKEISAEIKFSIKRKASAGNAASVNASVLPLVQSEVQCNNE